MSEMNQAQASAKEATPPLSLTPPLSMVSLPYTPPHASEDTELSLLLAKVNRAIVAVQTLDNDIRGDLGRREAAFAEQQALLAEARKIRAAAVEQSAAFLQSVTSMTHSMAEKDLAESIAKAVLVSVCSELTPQLKEAIEQRSVNSLANAKGMMVSAVVQHNTELAKTIADAISRKPQLPPMPPDDAPFLDKLKGRSIRCFTQVNRFIVPATLAIVLLNCCVVLYTAYLLKLV
jgi:hypothetical protein